MDSKKKIASDNSEVRNLIIELMMPRLVMINSIITTRIVPVTRDDDDYNYGHKGGDDWWPDYGLYSDSHAITDLNGLLYHAQNTLRGLPSDFQEIAKKFEYCQQKTQHNSSNDDNQSSRYRLTLSLFEDINAFIVNLNRLCDKWLSQRRRLYDEATATHDTADRIHLKVFDERTFVQLHSRMNNLKGFIADFGRLFQTRLKIQKDDGRAKPKGKLVDGKPKGKPLDKLTTKRNEKTTASKTKKVRLQN